MSEPPMISMTEADAIASMKVDGMLAPVIDEFRPHHIIEHAEWFDFARRFNRLGMRLMNEHVPSLNGKEIRHPVALVMRLAARVAHSFGGAIVLAERGQTVEAQTIVRSIYETGFWVAYIAKSPLAGSEDFISEEMKSQLGRDKAAKKLMADAPDVVRQIDQKIAQTIEARRGRREVPGIEKLATLGDFPDHFAYYKWLCGAAAHPTLLSTTNYLSADDEEGFYGFAFGPDSAGIGHTVGFACHAFSITVLGMCRLLGFLGAQDEMRTYIVELNALMAKSEPPKPGAG